MAALRRSNSTPLEDALRFIVDLPEPALRVVAQRLIDRLDELDPDCDLELGEDDEPDDDREPGPYWFSRGPVRNRNSAARCSLDRAAGVRAPRP